MLAQEFIRNALLAGSAIAIASGAVGYFVVLRAQVFAGDALSHVAFTGVLAAALAGIDLRVGLFAATIAVGLLFAALGDRIRVDDAAIGVVFAWVLGLGVLLPLPLQPRSRRKQRRDRGAHALRIDLQPHRAADRARGG